MQTTPFRLQQAIRAAFRASKPTSYLSIRPQLPRARVSIGLVSSTPWPIEVGNLRCYSDDKNPSVARQVEDAQKKIDNAIESRADTIRPERTALKQDETIIHTNPEASSIVHNPRKPGEAASRQAFAKSSSSAEPLPSEKSSSQSSLQRQFSHFMDNFQSHVFVASRRLNDLTGYSGIEALKKDIEAQEVQVQQARKCVKDTRKEYSAAIENRSTTQREVNDLLQRKHAWSPADLERFTNLYRSDHANEQAEQKAHEELSRAEVHYEEASTNLAKSILARYHEEQIWSDKIRQMSTWGTWGLMGLNVLLFIVFQIMIEPWRRKRLVRGFEEKVQEALKEREQGEIKSAEADQLVENAVKQLSNEGIVAVAGEQAAEAVADAIIGTSRQDGAPSRVEIEQATEQATTREALGEEATEPTVAAITETVQGGRTQDNSTGADNEVPGLSNAKHLGTLWANLPSMLFAEVSGGYAKVKDKIQELGNDKAILLISRRDLTASALEGAFVGAAVMATFLWTVGKSR